MNAKEKYILNPRDAVVWNAAIKAAAEVCEGRIHDLPICAESIKKEAGLMMAKRAILALLDTEGGGDDG